MGENNYKLSKNAVFPLRCVVEVASKNIVDNHGRKIF